MFANNSGLSSLGVPGVPWHTQYFADQLTLFQPGGTDYAQLITTGIPRFSDLPTALKFSAFSLEFQIFFLITRTIFSHSRSENFGNKIPLFTPFKSDAIILCYFVINRVCLLPTSPLWPESLKFVNE